MLKLRDRAISLRPTATNLGLPESRLMAAATALLFAGLAIAIPVDSVRGSSSPANADAPPFSARGILSTEIFKGASPTPAYRSEREFSITATGNQWQIECRVLSPEAVAGQGINCRNIVDGIRYFRLAASAAPAAKEATNFMNWAMAKSIPFPPPEEAGLLAIWMSLAPRPSLPTIDSRTIRPFVYSDLIMDPKNEGAYSLTFLSPDNLFISSLDITNNGWILRPGMSALQLHGPFGDGFHEFSFRALATTNILGTTFPLVTELRRYSPTPPRDKPGVPMLASLERLEVREVAMLKNPASEAQLVVSPDHLLAIDQRPSSLRAGATVQHIVTNDTWVPKTNANLVSLATIRNSTSKRQNLRVRIYQIALLLFAAGLPAGVWLLCRKQKQTK